MLNMTHRPREQIGYCTTSRVPSIPDTYPMRDLFSYIPCRNNVHESGGHSSFQHASDESGNQQLLKSHTCPCDGDYPSPKNNIDTNITTNRELLNENCGGIFPDEISDGEDAGHPRVLISSEVLKG